MVVKFVRNLATRFLESCSSFPKKENRIGRRARVVVKFSRIYELLEEKGEGHESIPFLRFFRPEARTISYTYNGTRSPCRGRCKFRNVGSLATCSRCIPAVFSWHPNSTGPFESCWLVGFRLDAVSLYRFILHLFASLSRRSAQVSWLLSFFLCLSTSRCCPPYKPQITNAYAIQPFFAPRSHGSSSRGS